MIRSLMQVHYINNTSRYKLHMQDQVCIKFGRENILVTIGDGPFDIQGGGLVLKKIVWFPTEAKK